MLLLLLVLSSVATVSVNVAAENRGRLQHHRAGGHRRGHVQGPRGTLRRRLRLRLLGRFRDHARGRDPLVESL